jgi:hypothetical protein
VTKQATRKEPENRLYLPEKPRLPAIAKKLILAPSGRIYHARILFRYRGMSDQASSDMRQGAVAGE